MPALAASLQILIALAFLSIPLVRHLYGPAAQAAAEAELARQDIPAGVLEENKIRFDAGGHETAAPAAVAALLITAAALNLAGHPWGRPLTLVLMPLILVASVLILWSQLTAAKSVQAAFKRKGDPTLARVDVPALLKAAEDGFPRWVFSTLQNTRHTIAFAGSALALAAALLT